MPVQTSYSYSYAVIRVVPRVERGEFINAGIIIWCPALKLLQAEISLDEERLAVLDPAVEMDEIRKHLSVIPSICRGEKECGAIAEMPPSQRFGWLTATRSTVIQTSPVHTGLCKDMSVMIKQSVSRLVTRPK